jgi:hypothetical protein
MRKLTGLAVCFSFCLASAVSAGDGSVGPAPAPVKVAAPAAGTRDAVASRTTPTTQYDSGDPTADEQYVLEMINRARANPTAEGTRLGIDITEGLAVGASAYVMVRPPLAMNKTLLAIARAHSMDMYTNNYFDHVDSTGKDPFQRMTAAGYNFTSAGENIAAGSSQTAAQLEDLLMVDAGIQDRGHRVNLLHIYPPSTPVFQEVGVGFIAQATPNTMQFAHFETQDFGTTGTGQFLVGVVYDDKNGNGFYDQGEGLAGIQVMPDSGTYFAVTSTSGGFVIPVTNTGTLNVTISGGTLTAPLSKMVTLSSANVKLDFNVSGGTSGTGGTGGTGGNGGSPGPLVVKKLSIKENLTKTGADTIQLSGTLSIPAGGSGASQAVVVSVGMLTFNLTTDMKGNALAAPNSFKIKVKAKKGVVLAQNATFTSKFVGSFAQTLQASGLTGASASVQIPVSVSVGSNSGSIVITQTFTSNGKIAKTK